jgi:hypothetical protein
MKVKYEFHVASMLLCYVLQKFALTKVLFLSNAYYHTVPEPYLKWQ